MEEPPHALNLCSCTHVAHGTELARKASRQGYSSTKRAAAAGSSFRLRADRLVLQATIVQRLAKRAVRNRFRHEFGRERQRERMMGRYRDRTRGLLEGFIQHARA